MSYERKRIAIKDLAYNEGQIEGVPANPREWSRDDVERLAESLRETPELFEMRCPIVKEVGGKYVVVGGNLRVAGAKKNKDKEVDCFVLPEGMSAEKIKEIAIKDNGAFGKWDFDNLANEWGVPAWETKVEEEKKEVEEDELEENKPQIERRAKRGDIWICGEHRVMCGDSTSEEDFQKLMQGELADLVFTDPPYGVSIGDKNKVLNSVIRAGRCCENIKNDNCSIKDLQGIIKKAMTNIRLNCKDDASYFITSPQGGGIGMMMMMMMMKEAGLEIRHVLMWVKNSATFSLGRLDYDYQHEPIFYTWTKSHHNYRKGEFRTSVWKIDKPRKSDLHPTMKPVKLVANCLLDGTKEGDIVLDGFGGSGTTLIACEQLKRRARIMEIDPHYVDVILSRWEDLTGEKAKRDE